SHLTALCTHLATLHSEAFCWDASSWCGPAFADVVVLEAERSGLGMRDLVRAFVHLLEVAEQHREIDVPALLGLAPAVSNNGQSSATVREEDPQPHSLDAAPPTVDRATEILLQ